MTDSPPPTPPTSPPTGGPIGAPAGSDDAVDWAHRELTGDNGKRQLHRLHRGARLVRSLGFVVLVLGVIALILVVVAFRSTPVVLAVLVVLALPAIVGPLVALRLTSRLAAAIRQPDQVVAQARDLVAQVTDSTELRELAGILGGRRAPEGPIVVRRGRIRRAFGTARLASTVVGQAQPDAKRHPLLLPFTPEKVGRLFSSLAWTWWGLWLAPLLIVIAGVALVSKAL